MWQLMMPKADLTIGATVMITEDRDTRNFVLLSVGNYTSHWRSTIGT